MNSTQKLTQIIAVFLIVAVNAWYATGIRFLTTNLYHPVEPAYASAYRSDHDQSLAIPVQDIDGGSFKNTGERVLFYIRNDYRSASEYTSPQLTLLIIFMASVVVWVAGKRSVSVPQATRSQLADSGTKRDASPSP